MKGKRVLITGATGMIGKPLSAELIRRGYEVVVLARNPQAAAQNVPGAAQYLPWSLESAVEARGQWVQAMDGADAVISLAGEPLFGAGRLTKAKYAHANQTRVQGMRGLVAAMRLAKQHPRVFLSGSSVGIYGFQGPEDTIVTEDTPPGTDNHADGNVLWEFAAMPAAWMGIRTVLLRTGIVWGPDDGMAYQQLGQFKSGWGGTVGEGLNWVPWIHIDDEVGIILHLLEREDLEGPFNLSAPNPVQYRDYVRMMGELVGKPVNRKMPAFMMELFMGETAPMVLHNRRMIPQRALDSVYRFKFPEARSALFDLFPKTAG